jgi:hypothetical protein
MPSESGNSRLSVGGMVRGRFHGLVFGVWVGPIESRGPYHSPRIVSPLPRPLCGEDQRILPGLSRIPPRQYASSDCTPHTAIPTGLN